MKTCSQLMKKMIEYYSGDPKRIQHFIKVHQFAKLIGEMEGLTEQEQFILETASIVHDIGIKASELKYGSSSGKYQEIEGPPIAEPILRSLGYEDAAIERVSYLIAHHHTYTDIKEIDYQILVEADFLVNIYEEGLSKETIGKVYKKIFKTNGGKNLCISLYEVLE